MLITRKSPRGGNPSLEFPFPLEKDESTRTWCYRLGFLKTGEKVYFSVDDARWFANKFGDVDKQYKTLQEKISQLKPRLTLRERLIVSLSSVDNSI